jgi:pteridine reductase
MADLNGKVALITGAAQRIGAAVARELHRQGMNLVLHYRSSAQAADTLRKELVAQREHSVVLAQADLCQVKQLPALVALTQSSFGRLDLLLNNASSFYPTPLAEVDEAQWDDLMGSNLKGPFFLAQAAAPLLQRHQGCIINMVDIHAERPKPGYPVYVMAKAGNAMMVKTLARELGPEVRVNGIAPGLILWPEEEVSAEAQQQMLERTLLGRAGSEQDIANAVLFLLRDADYVTGQIINVDGGRTVQQ